MFPRNRLNGEVPGIARSEKSASRPFPISPSGTSRTSAKKSRMPAARISWRDPDAENGTAARTGGPRSSASPRKRPPPGLTAGGDHRGAPQPREGGERPRVEGVEVMVADQRYVFPRLEPGEEPEVP